MSRVNASSPEFQSLLWAACRDDVTQEELAQLEQLADADSAMQLLVNYLQLDGELHRIICQQSSQDKCLKMLEVSAFNNPEAIEQFQSVSPVLPLFSTITQGTVGYFSSGWPMAYLVATVVMAVGLLLGSVVHVSQPDHVANQSALPSPSGRGAESMLPSGHRPEGLVGGRGAGGEGSENVAQSRPAVGRITGMVDCQFDRPKSQDLRPKTVVSLGDVLALRSGLLELTYNTGTKVILQGPVTYEVESAVGGYLSLGKLTAKLEKNDKRETLNAERSASSSSFIVHRSSFAVRTPTAIVTDLGTEFGVEVDQAGMHDVARVSRVGQGANGRQRRKAGRRWPSAARKRVGTGGCRPGPTQDRSGSSR